jgi:hypothetical protein
MSAGPTRTEPRRPVRWDSDAWQWVDAATGGPLTADEVETLGLDPGGRFLG